MSLNSKAIAGQIVALLEGIGIPAGIGAPLAIGPRVAAWVALGGMDVVREANCVIRRTTRFYVLLCYQIEEPGQVAATEEALMGAADAFVQALMDDLSLAGTAQVLAVSAAMADEPSYQLRAGMEFREYPLVVMADELGGYGGG
jgi:hypothetical protein